MLSLKQAVASRASATGASTGSAAGDSTGSAAVLQGKENQFVGPGPKGAN
ncbi:MAG TPA: hypothetical protein PKW80_08430 [Bacteroidales bacterium]|nr:hypothetical protein [Bacteroidales bacterium]